MAAQIDVELPGSIESLLDRLKSKFTLLQDKANQEDRFYTILTVINKKEHLNPCCLNCRVFCFKANDTALKVT